MKTQLSLDPNYQKTHYFFDTSRCKKRRTESTLLGPKDSGSHGTVFRLLSNETDEHVRHRFELYEKVWSYQKATIETILGNANNTLFNDLTEYIHRPLSAKLDCGFLSMSSNTANNLRILDEFSYHIQQSATSNNQHVRIVRLNSKVCFNGKAAIKEVVKQVIQEPKDTSHQIDETSTVFELNQEGDGIKEEDDEDDEDEDDDEDEMQAEKDDKINIGKSIDGENAEVSDEEGDESGSGRISYDFEIVEDWVQNYIKKNNCANNLRIVLVLDDADSFQNDVLNLLLQLFSVYSSKNPIKVILGLITKNVNNWININITSKLRNLIEGIKLEAKDNKDIGFRVINEILLQNIITEQNPLLVSARLSLIILNRFENSNNSIDSLITELKLSFMTYFYQLHLSSLLDPTFKPEGFHYDSLRKLSSFKTHVEFHLQKFVESGDTNKKDHILELLQDNNALQRLFQDARVKFQGYQNTVMNAVNIVYYLFCGKKEKFEIYKLITNNQLINSPFLTDLLKSLATFHRDKAEAFKKFLCGERILRDLPNCTDNALNKLIESFDKESFDLLEEVTNYFYDNKSLNMKINDNLFNEVLTINGGSSELEEQVPRFSIEENFENLMINLIRPKLREIIETGLDEPQLYFRNPLVSSGMKDSERCKRLLGPSLSRLYQIYKDAPVNINLWDFYSAFKQSLLKQEILREIEDNYEQRKTELNPNLKEFIIELKQSDEYWEKMTFSWFLQSCFELNAMGFIREKSKGDYMEKMLWRNL